MTTDPVNQPPQPTAEPDPRSAAPGAPGPTPEESTAFGLRPPSKHVDPRCRRWWAAQLAVWAVCTVGVLALLGLLIEPARWWFLGPAIAAAVLFGIAIALAPQIRWNIHRWEVTDEAVYSRSGLFWEEWRAAPLTRVQTVDKTRGPLQKSFGLATVVVTTASAQGAVRINALDDSVATEMVDRLTLLTKASPEDQDDQADAT